MLDLSRVLAGPWCTQILGDLGADVIKVERPILGDDTRGWGPPFLDDPTGQGEAQAAYYLGANRNKRSITCDIATAEGQASVRDLACRSQVFVENFKVGDLKRYALDYESLRQLNPSLVYCSITGFGQTGPYQHFGGYDYIVQGMGGLMSVTGERDSLGGGPQKVGVAVADLFTGMYATVAILAALRHAERTGQGQHLDICLMDTQVAMLANLGANYLISGVAPKRQGNAHQNIVPYRVFEVATDSDGHSAHLILAVGNDSQFQRFCSAAGVDRLASDKRFARNQDRVSHRDQLDALLEPVLRTQSKDQWLALLRAADVPCGPINNLDEVFQDKHVRARGMLQRWQHPFDAQLALVGSPIRMSQTPVVQRRAPPLLGQHDAEVKAELHAEKFPPSWKIPS